MCLTRYFLKTGSSSTRVDCEDLLIGARSIHFQNLQPDVLNLVQHRSAAGEWLGSIGHDTVLRLDREDPDTGDFQQVFCGRVISPEDVVNESGATRTIRVAGVLQAFGEFRMVRGSWDGTSISSGGVHSGVQPGNLFNSPVVGTHYGYNWASTLGGTFYKNQGQQSISAAVQEVVDFVYAQVSDQGLGSVWLPVLMSNYFGDNPLTPLPVWSENVSALEFLVRLVRPQVDSYCSVDYSGTSPEVRFGRFRDVSEVDLTAGFPLIETRVQRKQHEESLGVIVTTDDGSRDTVIPWWPVSPLVAVPSGARYLDRRIVTLTATTPPAGTPSVYGPILAESLTRELWTAQVALCGDAWQWCRPGAVLAVDGARLDVQRATWDLATDVVTAEAGVPRHLGVDDLEGLTNWLWRNVRAITAATTPA